ncbi:Replicative DNA helicase [Acholeplasma oculi]|uniref:Replicative DNA helicase n=1 Tax=Acholeplasma oculi TaxID=35623 RepID=A0A061AK04_9MOLU|nr:replicative DNA helicase [Acholeplasma oculi]CDR31342.1 Replicative DNA helicase DnaB [Acholeplasma oculi]SKC39174.1 replicative DNA helicase [Acholeplasma oculi]SUT91694.1 Replicative DNA helicase [Acholeplasma oculi]
MASRIPNAVDAEKSVLGAIFLDSRTAPNIFDQIHESDFFLSQHAVIYQAMKDLFNSRKDIDLTSVKSTLEHKGQLDTVGGLTYILELSEYTVSVSHIDTYIEIVKDLSLKRDVIKITQELATKGLTSDIESAEYLDAVETAVLSLSQRRKVGAFKPIPEIVQEVREKMHHLHNNKGDVTGLKTGFTTLDKFTNGFQPEELIIIAARPAVGKSAFAMNLALNCATKNKNGKAGVAIFSLEMSNEQLVTRMISSMSNIENSKLRTGFLTPQEWRNFETFTDILNEYQIFFDDSSSSNINEIRAKCRRLSQEGKLDLVVIDYLQLIQADMNKGSNRQEEVSKISRALKQMARELKIPVVALSQLSRDVEKSADKKPTLAHLRESGSIEQDADIVMFIHRDEYFNPKQEGEQSGHTELLVRKNRQGQIGDIKFIFSPQYSRFQEQSSVDESQN